MWSTTVSRMDWVRSSSSLSKILERKIYDWFLKDYLWLFQVIRLLKKSVVEEKKDIFCVCQLNPTLPLMNLAQSSRKKDWWLWPDHFKRQSDRQSSKRQWMSSAILSCLNRTLWLNSFPHVALNSSLPLHSLSFIKTQQYRSVVDPIGYLAAPGRISWRSRSS